MIRKKNILITLVFIGFFSLSLVFFPACGKKTDKTGEKKSEEKVIKIGAILPLTGNLSVFGNWIKKGINLAVKEKKEMNIEVIYEDNMGQSSNSVSAFHKLSSKDKAHALITAQTQVAKALLPLINSKKLFTVFTFSDFPEGRKDYVINYHFPVIDEINVLSKFAYEKLGKKGAILVVNDEFGNLSAKIFNKVFEENGGEIVFEEHFSYTQDDFPSMISKLKKVEPDFLFIIAYTDKYVAITKTLKEMNLEIPIVGPNVLTVYLSMVKEYLPTSYFTSSSYDFNKDSNTDEYLKFVQVYKEYYNEEPNSVNAEAYEATKILIQAFEKNKQNLDIFYGSFKNYKGIFGGVVVDEDRQAHFPLVIIKYSQGATKQDVVWRFYPKDFTIN